jgi:hypothetical protein
VLNRPRRRFKQQQRKPPKEMMYPRLRWKNRRSTKKARRRVMGRKVAHLRKRRGRRKGRKTTNLHLLQLRQRRREVSVH